MPKDIPQDAAKYTVLTMGLPAGQQALWPEGGKLRAFFQFNDRGRGPKTYSTFALRAYDSMNRLSRISFGATAAAPTVFESTIDYTYDKGDRLLRALDSVGGAIDSTYDGLDRLTKETTPLGTVNYSYDKAGRRTQMLPSGQQSVDYAYDAASRLTEVRNAVSATAPSRAGSTSAAARTAARCRGAARPVAGPRARCAPGN